MLLCHELGIETAIDLDALIAVARRAEAMLERPLPGKAMKSGGLSLKRAALRNWRARQDSNL